MRSHTAPIRWSIAAHSSVGRVIGSGMRFSHFITCLWTLGLGIAPLTIDAELGKFYMYPLPEKYWWTWPLPQSNCSRHGQLSHLHSENMGKINNLYHFLSFFSDLSLTWIGMGIPLDLKSGLFNTWHFSLFNSLFNRLRRSSRRTFNPEEASLFIIPYDLGMDGNFRQQDCLKVHRCSPGYVQNLWKNITERSPYFNKFQGIDHVLLWSLGHYHPWPRNDCNVLMGNLCKLCGITCYWMDPVLPDNHFVSIPFPSSYHWSEQMTDVPWKQISTHSTSTEKEFIKRIYFISYLGGTQTLNPEHTKIRKEMTRQCLESPNQTLPFLSFGGGTTSGDGTTSGGTTSGSQLCNWIQLSHSSTDKNLIKSLQIYRKSIFCLCPPGDDPARKALFDIILSGCIPVLFHPSTLVNQYPFHINEQIAKDISIYIPGKQLLKNKYGKSIFIGSSFSSSSLSSSSSSPSSPSYSSVRIIDLLLSIPFSIIKKKQKALEEIAPQLQYSIPPLEMLQDRHDERVWDPPFRDAVDLMLDGFIQRAEKLKRNESTGIPSVLRSNAEWFQRYNTFIP
jgi:hypothetical protein